jgi:hypothetical protein
VPTTALRIGNCRLAATHSSKLHGFPCLVFLLVSIAKQPNAFYSSLWYAEQ